MGAQKLEEQFIPYFASYTRDEFAAQVLQKLKEDKIIWEGMANGNMIHLEKIEQAIQLMERLIANEYQTFSLGFFQPYDNKIATMIDRC